MQLLKHPIKGYEAFNEPISEELTKVVLDTYPAKS